MIRTLSLGLCLILFLPLFGQPTLSLTIEHASCGASVGSIWPQYTGPYYNNLSYTWSNGTNGSSLIDVPPGIYTLTVTNPGGDTLTSSAEILLLNELFPTFELTAYSCWDTCYGGVMHPMTGLGMDTAYSITLDPPAGYAAAVPGQLMLTDLCIGTQYTATITRSDGCQGFVGPITVDGPEVPVLLSTTIDPSCAGGATGSVTFVFDEIPIDIRVWNPDTIFYPSLPITNPYTFHNLPTGVYNAWATSDFLGISLDQGCTVFFDLEIPETTEPCGLLSGSVFADVDDDCIQGAAEVGLPYRILSVEPGDHLIITNASGGFSTEYLYGSYDLNTTLIDYGSDCISLPFTFTMDASNTSTSIELPLSPLFGPDVQVFLYAGVHTPGLPVSYHINISNQGPYNFTGLTLDLLFEAFLIADSVDGSPTVLAPGHYEWSGIDLAPFQSINLQASFTVPANADLIGTTVNSTVTVSGNTGDDDPTNDSYGITPIIIGPYDPNDKLVQTSSRISESEYFIDQDNWIDYTIRFQNTGTAPAINVYLVDTIAAELDLMSLQILASSHSFIPSIQEGHVLRFDFPGIMLPDSSANLLGSQGFVSFRMKPMDGLILGTVVSNEADIYFDFNEPIRTNSAELVIDITVGVHEELTEQIALYPNPADEMIVLELAPDNWNIDLISVDGRIVRTLRNVGSRTVFDLEGIAPGHYMIQGSGDHGNRAIAKFVRQ